MEKNPVECPEIPETISETSEILERTDNGVRSQVEEVIEMIRPALQMDGGDIELVDIDDDRNVIVQLQGACIGCPASAMTLKAGVERILKDHIPEINEVISA